MKPDKKSNRLIHEKSPYLLQHAYNPVEWYPWGEEAFAKARQENKPIFLSIGYSTCYWCHVMEREVFEDTAIARLMNEKLVCIKIDREERPDIDRIYMASVQAMTGGGGWPMSVFLTHDLKPFYGATYIPPTSQYGRPGFPDVVHRIDEAWHTDRTKLIESSEHLAKYLQEMARSDSGLFLINDSVSTLAFHHFKQAYDPAYGGFGGGPKFPRPVGLNFLFRYHARTGDESAREMSLSTLRAMAQGGMYDHVGGGFHRYSVDGQWRVPHFEKMLYDQAQLAVSYIEAFQITHDTFYADVARDILDYVLRDMTDLNGGFYSAEDAESVIDVRHPDDKEEGAFYVWSKSEIDHILGNDAPMFNYYFGVQDTGNALHDPMNAFTGKNILYVAHDRQETADEFKTMPLQVHTILKNSRDKLSAERNKRPRPHLDDKIITAWNGLMISAFAKAYQVFDDRRYLDASERAAQFIITKLYIVKTGTLLRRFRDGDARFAGGLQDYSFYVQGLLDLYESSFDGRWFKYAVDLTTKQIELFWDTDHGAFYDTPSNEPSLLVRTKEDYDGAEPSGNSVAVLNLIRLSQMTDNKGWRSMAERTITVFGSRLQRIPDALAQMVVSVEWMLSKSHEIIIVGKQSSDDTKALLHAIRQRFIPNKIVILKEPGIATEVFDSYLPFTTGMHMVDNKPTVYICEHYACQLPTSDVTMVERLLSGSVDQNK